MPNIPRNALRSLTLLVIWEMWKERNARVFRQYGRPATEIVDSIKGEALLWIKAGDTALANLLVRE
ncbi:hypothetical protein HU200_062426 [Digitaria exilis]|uniref:Uncharacterized protein n=1 Tax=Digitaria exilis TaxID=1010633 RepID=A0A835A5P1_9POAL|nr:hypothetical protein HU200_062426 [Digitaria exilis]